MSESGECVCAQGYAEDDAGACTICAEDYKPECYQSNGEMNCVGCMPKYEKGSAHQKRCMFGYPIYVMNKGFYCACFKGYYDTPHVGCISCDEAGGWDSNCYYDSNDNKYVCYGCKRKDEEAKPRKIRETMFDDDFPTGYYGHPKTGPIWDYDDSSYMRVTEAERIYMENHPELKWGEQPIPVPEE
eukprot:g2798.t1